MNETNREAFEGLAAADSPLREIFHDGRVPLTSPLASRARLGPPGREVEHSVYFIAVKACTAEQREGMARLMHRMGQGTLAEAREEVATGEPIPVRDRNFHGVSFPLRYVV